MTQEPWTLGIDPPNGWGAWTRSGPLRYGWGRGRRADDQRRDLAKQVAAFVEQHGPPCAIALEKPYGAPKADRVQALIEQAIGHGWLLRELEATGATMWCPLPGQWRRHIGLANMKRTRVKEVMKRLACKAWQETRGTPMSAPSDHAHEALVMAMVVWMKEVPAIRGDAAASYRATGSFVEGRHAEGGDPRG